MNLLKLFDTVVFTGGEGIDHLRHKRPNITELLGLASSSCMPAEWSWIFSIDNDVDL